MCQKCKEGYHSAVEGADRCYACGSGRVSPDGISCKTCPKGTYSGYAKTTCQKCGPGTYAAKEGTAICKLCIVFGYVTDGIFCK